MIMHFLFFYIGRHLVKFSYYHILSMKDRVDDTGRQLPVTHIHGSYSGTHIELCHAVTHTRKLLWDIGKNAPHGDTYGDSSATLKVVRHMEISPGHTALHGNNRYNKWSQYNYTPHNDGKCLYCLL